MTDITDVLCVMVYALITPTHPKKAPNPNFWRIFFKTVLFDHQYQEIRTLRNWLVWDSYELSCQGLYWLGVPPPSLKVVTLLCGMGGKGINLRSLRKKGMPIRGRECISNCVEYTWICEIHMHLRTILFEARGRKSFRGVNSQLEKRYNMMNHDDAVHGNQKQILLVPFRCQYLIGQLQFLTWQTFDWAKNHW